MMKMIMNSTHTIVSRELIKPSSPTPSHLRTYNLSVLDLRSMPEYMPLILYYPNNDSCSLTPNDKVLVMKKSLSQSLTRYYPFAGRLHAPSLTYIDCNDEGAVFVEAKHDTRMNMLQHVSEEDNIASQLFVHGMFWGSFSCFESLLGVQVNRFACGGMAVAISLSHVVGDGCTLASFASHWASVARYGSVDHKEVLPLNPNFVEYSTITNFVPLEVSGLIPTCTNPITRKFVFPNLKLSELKKKVVTEDGSGSKLSIKNPTRVEVLTSLLYKTVMVATTKNSSSSSSSSFKPCFLLSAANVRSKFVPELPQTTVGNYNTSMLAMIRHENETALSVLVSKIRKQKTELERLENVQLVHRREHSMRSSFGNEDVENVKISFMMSSLCGFPYYKVDFGWGNPAVSSMTLRHANRAGSYLMDTPNGDGIEAWVTLDTQDMERFQNDKELLSFCEN